VLGAWHKHPTPHQIFHCFISVSGGEDVVFKFFFQDCLYMYGTALVSVTGYYSSILSSACYSSFVVRATVRIFIWHTSSEESGRWFCLSCARKAESFIFLWVYLLDSCPLTLMFCEGNCNRCFLFEIRALGNLFYCDPLFSLERFRMVSSFFIQPFFVVLINEVWALRILKSLVGSNFVGVNF